MACAVTTRPSFPEPLLISHRLVSTTESVRATLATLMSALAAAGLGDAPCGMIELVIAESLNNIVEHAYRDQAGGYIALEVTLQDRRVEVRIEDRGLPMPDNILPPPQSQRLDGPRADIPEGGFGWGLIHSLSSQLIYSRKDGRNRLLLQLDLDRLG